MTPEERDQQIAMVFLETWGSTSYPPERWEPFGPNEPGFQWSEGNYAPEWLSASDLGGVEPDECVTVLSFGLSEHGVPEGYVVAYQYAAGEKECPWCECPPDDAVHPLRRCELCEGDGLLYWGEECQVLVIAPAWVVGAGQSGCLYDWGPYRWDSKDAAIENAIDSVCEELSERTRARVRRDLQNNGFHRFDRRLRPFVGHDLVEVSHV